MTKAEAINEALARAVESDKPGVPWLVRPVDWSGTGRAVAPMLREDGSKLFLSTRVISRPDDINPNEIVVPEDGDWEVLPLEVWQQERRHGAN